MNNSKLPDGSVDNNKGKYILIIGKGTKHGLDGTTFTAEA